MNGSHKRRMLTTMRGGMPDKIPFAPRLDLWFTAHKHRGTLPAAYQDCRHWEDVSRKHGWAFAKTVPEYNEYPEEALLDRTLGFYRIPSHQGFIPHLPKDVERRVTKVGDQVQVEYMTPKGVVRGAYTYTDQMRRSGVSIPWISGHALKGPEDYPPLSYLFENIEVERDYQSYSDWEATLGEDGYAVQYAMNAGLTVLDPHLSAGGQRARGKVLIGTVHGDLHDIGKNMVMIMLRGIGFEVVDLGINLPVAEFVKKVAEEKPDILGMSALLTTTMPQMKAVIEALGKAGLRDKVKVMIGGAPVNSTFARQIGADGYAADAGEAVEIAKGLLAIK